MAAELSIKALLERVSAGRCLLCGARSSRPGLCRGCTRPVPTGTFPAQLRSRPPQPAAGGIRACLIDCFGQLHSFCIPRDHDATLTIGRETHCALAIVEPRVSREHALLCYRAEPRCWELRDLGSRNGTDLDGVRVNAEPARLHSGAWIRIALFRFLFLADDPDDPRLSELAELSAAVDKSTISNLPLRRLRFAPTDGAGGFVVIEQGLRERDKVSISLSTLDFALLHLLAGRYLETSNFEDQARGWIQSAELLAEPLPFGTDTPTSNNLRGAIKRIRDKCRKQGVAAVIESRQNLGYRLMPGFEHILL